MASFKSVHNFQWLAAELGINLANLPCEACQRVSLGSTLVIDERGGVCLILAGGISNPCR